LGKPLIWAKPAESAYREHRRPRRPQRHVFDANVSEYGLVNMYLSAFRATVIEGKADSIMCVYNSVAGVPGCASTDLLQKRLRDQWGFQGYVVSDCGAVNDIYANHKYTSTLGGAAVAAAKAGTDLTCGTEYRTVVNEVKAGRILPLSRSIRKIEVIDPSADDPVALLGNYNGISSKQVTPLEGIERQFSLCRLGLPGRSQNTGP